MADFANNFKRGLAAAEFDLNSDTVRVLAMQSGYTFDPDNVFLSEVSSEATATGYARQTLTGKSVVKDDTADVAKLHCDDVLFGNMGGAVNNTIVGFLFAKIVTNDADSPIIGFRTSPNFTTDGTPVTLDADPVEGILQFTG